MIKYNVTIEACYPDGQVIIHRACNDITQDGLNFIAKKLAGESDPINFEEAWTLFVDVSAKTSVAAAVAFDGQTASISAEYTPASAINWLGKSLALDIVSLRIATANPSNFKPSLIATPLGTKLTFKWSITIGHSGQILSGISGGSPYISANEREIIIDMMNVLRGVVRYSMSSSSLAWYTIEQPSVDDLDNPGLVYEGNILDSSIVRSDNVLTFTWDLPSATEPTEGYRDRIIVPSWNNNAWSAHRVNLPLGTSGTTIEVSIPLTVT